MEKTIFHTIRPARDINAHTIDSICITVLSAIIFCTVHWNSLTSMYVINDDVRQQIFWMQKWRVPTLFQDDLLSDYARLYVPWGVKALYRLAAVMVNPLYFSSLLPGLLFIWLAFLLYRIGLSISGRAGGFGVVAVYWLMPFFLFTMSGGLARSFASPLIALFILSWMEGAEKGILVALLAQALFIPYIFLLCFVAVILGILFHKAGFVEKSPVSLGYGQVALLVIGCLIIYAFNYQINSAGYGPMVSLGEAGGRPEFTVEGRYAFIPVPFFWTVIANQWGWIAPFREGGIAVGIAGSAAILACTAYGALNFRWKKKIREFQPIIILIFSALLLYHAAWVFAFKLFIPSRYGSYLTNIIFCLVLGICLGNLSSITNWKKKWTALVICFLMMVSFVRLWNVGIYDYSSQKVLYNAVGKLPEHSLIAGHPELMDNVMTFGKRPAYITFELAHPWLKGYWSMIRPRIEEFFHAYYTDDAEKLKDFIEKWKIDFLIVDEHHFSSEFINDRPFFSPFDTMIRNLTQDRKDFTLISNKEFEGIRMNSGTRLIDVRKYQEVQMKMHQTGDKT